MARRRKVSFPTMSGGEVSFFVRDEPKKKIDREKKERAKLKREIVNEVMSRGLNYADVWEEKEVRRAARLAIALWEKRK